MHIELSCLPYTIYYTKKQGIEIYFLSLVTSERNKIDLFKAGTGQLVVTSNDFATLLKDDRDQKSS